MEESHVWREIRSVLSVSFTEAFISIIFLVALCFNTTVIVLNRDGAVDQSVDRAAAALQLQERYGDMSGYINSNQYVGTAVVFMLWSILGLILCNIAFFARYSEKSIVELWRTVRQGGPDGVALLEEKAVRLIVRTLGIIGLIVITIVFTKYLLPVIVVALDVSLLYRLKDYIFSVASVWLLLSVVGHATVVLLRFILLKKRLFFAQPAYAGEDTSA